MPKIYIHLTAQERAIVMTMPDDQCSIRTIAKRLGRAPSSISRELRRAPGEGGLRCQSCSLAQWRTSSTAAVLAEIACQ